MKWIVEEALKIARRLGWPGFVLMLAAGTLCLSLLTFSAVADEMREGELQQLEEQILLSMRSPEDPSQSIGPYWVRMAAIDITSLGGAPVLTLVTLLVTGFLLLSHRFGAAVLVIVATAGGGYLSSLLKQIFARPRPDVVPHLSEVLAASFPSGHSMASSVVYLTLGVLLAQTVTKRRLKVYVIATALFLAFLVGLTRVYLGVHYPTDVLAGWTAGTAWATLCWLVTYWLQRRGKVPTAEEHTMPPDDEDAVPERLERQVAGR